MSDRNRRFGVRRWIWIPTALLAVGLSIPAAYAQFGQISCDGTMVPTERLALAGEGWSPYCYPCVAANRTFGRIPVVRTVEAALTHSAAAHPGTHFLYGEIGLPSGGPFPPHRTHREGLSVDIMVPLKDGAVLPTHVFNRFGYDEEFDRAGRGASGEIHFEALATLILALEAEARERGGRVRRVILAPDLQPELKATARGAELARSIAFNTRQSWVRHDDHIHVDFEFPCQGAP